MVRPEFLPSDVSTAAALQLTVMPWSESPHVAETASWQALVEQCSAPNPFYEPWALIPALRHLHDGNDIRMCALQHGDRLVGLMPVIGLTDYYDYPFPHWTNWLHHNAFCGSPLVANGYEAAFWSALLDWADGAGGKKLFFHLRSQPSETSLHSALAEVLETEDRAASVVLSEERALLQSDHTAEVYYAGAVRTKQRKELRRQARRLGELGELTFARSEDVSGLDTWIADFLELEKAGWKGEEGSALAQDEGVVRFFSEALAGAAEAGRLERLTLSLDDKPIAMLANFLTAPGAYSFKTAYDERYYKYSPGVLLQRENLALLEREDIDWCDSCAAADHPMINHLWRERRTIQSANIAIGGPLRRTAMKALARLETGHFPKGLR